MGKLQIDGWRYYNHAAVPTIAPHEEANLLPIKNGSIWRIGGGIPILARWTEDFDCNEKTNWWYCILDQPFDISELKAKRRYNINKGNRFFDVREIEPLDYKSELIKVQIAAFSAYPEKYRPTVDKADFITCLVQFSKEVKAGKCLFYGAFYRKTNELCGYHIVTIGNGFRGSNVLKTNPKFEKYQVNAALVYKWVIDAEKFIRKGGYLQNGTRTINHETAFQDYLEYYFGFRKAYCRLRIKYHPIARLPVKLLYHFRKRLREKDDVGIIHQINAVLRMEEIARGEYREG